MKTSSRRNQPTSTTKKRKLVGCREFVDASTGEVVPMQIVQVEDRDFNFHKVWLQNLITSLDGISNQRLRLAFWILDNLDGENKLVMTQRMISEKSGVCLDTVAKTMKALQSGNPAFLQKINSGAYRVNPDVIWKGGFNKRMGICFEYNQAVRDAKKDNELPHDLTEAKE